MLLAAKETKRLDQTKVELGTRHGNAKDAAFFFDLLGAIRRHVGRYATIRDTENINHIPFLSFSRMDRRQNEVVFIKQWRSGFGTGSLGRPLG